MRCFFWYILDGFVDPVGIFKRLHNDVRCKGLKTTEEEEELTYKSYIWS